MFYKFYLTFPSVYYTNELEKKYLLKFNIAVACTGRSMS